MQVTNQFSGDEKLNTEFSLRMPLIAQLLSLVLWAPLAALAGMGYSPGLSFTNVSLILFHLYPAFILIAFPVAYSLKQKGNEVLAKKVAYSPPLIAISGFTVIILWGSIHGA